MSCDIFIRSYWKDFEWLDLCLAAIEKFCEGFRSVVVVVPRSSEAWLRRLSPFASNVRLELCKNYADDYLGQQVTKLEADRTTDADLICHVDSDCIFARRTTPDDLLSGGKPRIVMRPYASLGRHWPWQKPTERVLGWNVSHDFMQQPPFTYPGWIYAALREHVQAVHAMDVEHYILSRPPRGFSEFNALGAFAHHRYAEHFAWHERSGDDDRRCRWYWSWGGLDDVREEIRTLLGEGAVDAITG